MKIGINTFGCDHGRSGIGSYILSLVKNLPEGIDDQVALFGPELDRYTYSSGVDSVTYSGVHVSDSLLAERAWHITSFPVFARKQKYDAVLFPSGMNLLPLKFDVPVVPVMHEVLSDTYNNSDEGLITGFFRMQLKKAAGIIAPSRFVRDDLINHNIPESRIRVIYHGIDTSLFYPRPVLSNDAVLIHPFSIRRPYILYASRVAYPSKCHVQLIQAFELFKKKKGAPHRLVLAGADGVNAEMVHREVIRSSVSSDILLTGYFPHQSLPDLYSASDACIFPSAAEGVGLPVLEAMACGIPVACARAAALPEVAADAAIFFDQNNPQEIADAIERLVRTPSGENESFRTQMIERGLERVSAFSWKTCAKETLDFLSSTIRS
jgi:glycosyltransferase involved in cell wall biosynthesis